MRRMPCRRYKHQDNVHDFERSPASLSGNLSMGHAPAQSLTHPVGGGRPFADLTTVPLSLSRTRHSFCAPSSVRRALGVAHGQVRHLRIFLQLRLCGAFGETGLACAVHIMLKRRLVLDRTEIAERPLQ